jgi:hypothetical protein
MSAKVIILSTDKIRGAILYKAFEKDLYSPVLLNNIINFRSSALLNPRAVVVLDAGTFYLNELKEFKNISTFVEAGFLIIIDALEDNKNAVLQGIAGVRFPHLPIDPEAVVQMAGEILNALVGTQSVGASSSGASPADAMSVGSKSADALLADAIAPAYDTRTGDSILEDLKRFLNLR